MISGAVARMWDAGITNYYLTLISYYADSFSNPLKNMPPPPLTPSQLI